MREKWILTAVLGLGLALAGPARADVWDVQASNDNTIGTGNELVHGSDQLHDLAAVAGVADQDWYRISQKARSSYEIVADATSGNIGTTLLLERIANDGTTQVQAAIAVGVGYSKSLRWQNGVSGVDDQFIKVSSTGCTTACTSGDSYRLRALDTTYSVPRYNNSGSQITVLIIQNPTSYAVSGTIFFWNTTGTTLANRVFSLPANNTLVLNTNTVIGLTGTSGAITVTHDARYGDLSGKTVALEPSTGFSFDTPMLVRPH